MPIMTAMTKTAAPKPAKALPDAQTVTEVQHYTDRLFRFRVNRPQSLRFRSGEFVMIGLMGEPDAKGKQKPLLRAYSIASPSWDEELEFYSIKVPDGPLTSRLQNIQKGDEVILRPKPVGTLVLDALLPGKRLWMIATGTGIAPFASLMRDPETYERFDEVILTHTCRQVAELAYGEELESALMEDPLVGEVAQGKFRRYATVTQEAYPRTGRITTLIENGELFQDLGVPAFDPTVDRAMICGSMGLNMDMKALLEAAGLTEGANSKPAEYVVERAFVD
ncbi:MAG: ferredoxin--NADP reductase [Pseudomonadota bacterium]